MSEQLLALEGQSLLSEDSTAEINISHKRYRAYSILNTSPSTTMISVPPPPERRQQNHLMILFLKICMCLPDGRERFTPCLFTRYHLHTLWVLQRLLSSTTKITCDRQVAPIPLLQPRVEWEQQDTAAASHLSAACALQNRRFLGKQGNSSRKTKQFLKTTLPIYCHQGRHGGMPQLRAISLAAQVDSELGNSTISVA